MLKSIRLVNFQGHKDTKIDFSDGDTVIIGSTDSGKSSVLRAIEWVRTNRPLGTSFIHKGESTCKVELEIVTKSGSIVTAVRERGPGVNSYTVDGEVLEAPGSGVPEKLQELLNVGELNVQTQLDPHFMILDTPGKVAQTINAVTHLEEADRVITKLISMGKENKSKIGFLTEKLAKEQEKRADPVFGLLADFEAALDVAEKVEKNQEGLSNRCEGLRLLLDSLSLIDQGVGERETKLRRFGDLDDVVSIVPAIVDRLAASNSKFDQLHSAVVAFDSAIGACSGAQLTYDCYSDLNEVEERASDVVGRLEDMLKVESGLSSVLTDIKGAELLLGNAEKTKKKYDEEWVDLLTEMDVCPVCESVLDSEHKKIAVESLS